MGDEPIELDLEFGGGIIGEENHDEGGRNNSNYMDDEQYDPFFDVDGPNIKKEETYDEDDYGGDGGGDVYHYDSSDFAAASSVGMKKEDAEDTDDDENGCTFTTDVANQAVKKEEDEATTDEEEDVYADNTKKKTSSKKPPPAKTKMKYIQGPPPSLLHFATQTVAANIEKYPPVTIGLALSEHYWENVIRARVVLTKESSSSSKSDGSSGFAKRLNGNAHIGLCSTNPTKKQLMPSISHKYLEAIEKHPRNVHLSKSKVADELLWKDIVNYHYSGLLSRPSSLVVPCNVLKEKLKSYGEVLVASVECPLSKEEHDAKVKKLRNDALASNGDNVGSGAHEYCGSKRQRRRSDEEMKELFGQESDDEDEQVNNNNINVNNGETGMETYQQYLEMESYKRSTNLQNTLQHLMTVPMDVTLLAETDVGKCASKTVKAFKKLKKQKIKNTDDEREIEENLLGYPRFLKAVSWGRQPSTRLSVSAAGGGGGSGGGNKWEELNMSPMELLQQILNDWKDMASDENHGAESSAADAPPPSKKRKTNNYSNNAGSSIPSTNSIATCGKDKKLSTEQHAIDMKLLHASPDWRSLYQSLRKRVDIVQKSHGEKVRSIRESLERDRRTVGKVTLKRAVGRVRGGDIDLKQNFQGNIGGGKAMSVGASAGASLNQSLTGSAAASGSGSASAISRQRKERRDAILSKSLGHRARQQQQQQQYSRDGQRSGNAKLSQLRQETKTAAALAGRPSAARAKSSFSASIATASFGASVARASGNSSGSPSRKKQSSQIVQLRGGKQMKLPPSSVGRGATTGKAGNAVSSSMGVFSSLQQKKKVKEQHKQRQQQMQRRGMMGKPPPGSKKSFAHIVGRKR